MTAPSNSSPTWDQAPTWPPTTEWCQVEEIYRPRVEQGTAPSRSRNSEIQAAVVAAYHGTAASGAPLIMAWCRPAATAPVTILSSTVPSIGTRTSALVFPPGTRGRETDSDAVLSALEQFPYWTPIGGCVEAAEPDTPAPRPVGAPAVLLEDGLLSVWHEPFAWLLLAVPLSQSAIKTVVAQAVTAENRARAYGPASAAHVLEAEQQRRRHRDHTRGAVTGVWRISLLAGAGTAAGARAVAGLLTAATDLSAHRYSLAPDEAVLDLRKAMAHRAEGEGGHSCPFVTGSAVLAALCRLPEAEIPGIRLIPRPTFDVTPEARAAPGGGTSFELGVVLDRDGHPTGPLSVTPDTLNRHTFVCGATGTGKSQTIKVLLEQLAHAPRPVPWLVIEPAKAEYARMAGRLSAGRPLLVIRPGELDALPGCLNPLEPEPGFPLQTHLDLVRALFLAAFEAQEPFPQVLARALTRCYTDLGWNVTLGEPRATAVRPRYPTLGDLQRSALHVVAEIGYGQEVTDNVRGFIDVRIGSLRLGTPGRFFEGGHPLDLAEILARNTVLELEDIGNDQDKAFVIGAILIRIIEHLRIRGGADRAGSGAGAGAGAGLRHVTVLEEAHRLLKRASPGSPAAHAVEMFAELLAEIRAYGEGVVVAEQIPTKIIADVLKNSALKIVHRLPAEDDRRAVGATMNLTEDQSRHLVTLPPGQAAVFTDGMDNAILTAVPLHEAAETVHGISRTPGIRAPRSAACPTDCATRPCTLRQLAKAGHHAQDPHLVLWIELHTAAHIVGARIPRPDGELFENLRAGIGPDPRALDCAITHRIQEAIDSRYSGLADYYQPEAFAEHLADCARSILHGGIPTCSYPAIEWQAGRFRWFDVARALTAPTPRPDLPHPNTDDWLRRGLRLPGPTCAEQLEQLDAHPDSWKPPRTVVTGVGDPPAYARAVAQLSRHPDPAQRFEGATRLLNVAGTWPSTALAVAEHLGSEERM